MSVLEEWLRLNDQTIQILIFKLVNNPDAFTIGEIDDLTIALRARESR